MKENTPNYWEITGRFLLLFGFSLCCFSRYLSLLPVNPNLNLTLLAKYLSNTLHVLFCPKPICIIEQSPLIWFNTNYWFINAIVSYQNLARP